MADPEPTPSQDAEAVAPRTPPEQTPAAPPAPPQPQSSPHARKRALESNPSIRQSKYLKIRSTLKELRPHFVEVLKTPSFRECKAADEIRENMKILMDLYKQLVTETTFIGKCTNIPEGLAKTAEARGSQQARDCKSTDQTSVKLSENKQHTEGVGNGQSLVGGSAFGWNFVTFPVSGSEPVYYGITKESFRAAQVNMQGK
ncbi:hypothetical protein SAY87_030859 [Trapa incisa]|uniref:Uncharacterized protein n=1 Tax=Trapa incisa TaxID=236973 RepID=A0AAN7QK55_9MYRT|nr:hypothetical protein SAY87_030859 [Trapa incisa]